MWNHFKILSKPWSMILNCCSGIQIMHQGWTTMIPTGASKLDVLRRKDSLWRAVVLRSVEPCHENLWTYRSLNKTSLNEMVYIDVGDRCWRLNELVTTSRFWWQFWPFWSPTSTTFLHWPRASPFKRCHRDRNSVTNIQKLSPTLSHQHHCQQWNDILNQEFYQRKSNLLKSPIVWIKSYVHSKNCQNQNSKN